jgi:integrase
MSQNRYVATRRQLGWSPHWALVREAGLSASWNFSQVSTSAEHPVLLGCGVRHAEIVGPRIEDVQLREDHWVIEAASPQWGE